jgi:hypothetical protein
VQIQIPEPSDRYIATILAALRYFQANRDDVLDCDIEHFTDATALTFDEIDDLCISINLDTV